MDKKRRTRYHAVGFGSNYWHQFGTLNSPLTALALSVEDDSGEGYSDQEQTLAFNKGCVFPLHQDTYTSADNTNTKSYAKSPRPLNRFIRLKRSRESKKIKKEGSDSNLNSLNADGKNTRREMEIPFGSDSNPLMYISSGAGYTVTVNQSGQIYMTGTLHGRTHIKPTIQPARIPLKCTQISCGRRHTLALFEGKVTMSWGSGYFGQLGHGADKVFCKEPTVIDRLMPHFVGGDVVSVFAGGMNSAVIVAGDASTWKKRHDGRIIETRVFRFGSNKFNQCAISDSSGKFSNAIVYPTPMVDVCDPESGRRVSFLSLALGRLHSVGLCQNGDLYSWGFTPRCGHKSKGSSNSVKSALKSKSGTLQPKRIDSLRGINIVQVAAGDAHTLALSDGGMLYSWGCGSSGQLGHGNEMDSLRPKLITVLQFKHGGPSRTNNGLVTTQFDAYFSEKVASLGTAESTNSSNGRILIAAAGNYSAMVTPSGDLFTWGCNADGQLGHQSCQESSTYAQLKGDSSNNDLSFQFDSTPTVQIPRRVECLRDLDLRVQDVSLGMHFTMLLCSHHKSNDS